MLTTLFYTRYLLYTWLMWYFCCTVRAFSWDTFTWKSKGIHCFSIHTRDRIFCEYFIMCWYPWPAMKQKGYLDIYNVREVHLPLNSCLNVAQAGGAFDSITLYAGMIAPYEYFRLINFAQQRWYKVLLVDRLRLRKIPILHISIVCSKHEISFLGCKLAHILPEWCNAQT